MHYRCYLLAMWGRCRRRSSSWSEPSLSSLYGTEFPIWPLPEHSAVIPPRKFLDSIAQTTSGEGKHSPTKCTGLAMLLGKKIVKYLILNQPMFSVKLPSSISIPLNILWWVHQNRPDSWFGKFNLWRGKVKLSEKLVGGWLNSDNIGQLSNYLWISEVEDIDVPSTPGNVHFKYMKICSLDVQEDHKECVAPET